MPEANPPLMPVERIERAILLVRGQKVMLDRDLAELYGVLTKVLNQAVKRNQRRFPADFMFQLSPEEYAEWRSQIVTTIPGATMGVRRRPYAFTEQGVAMLSSVLNSDRATHKDLARKLEALEKKYDAQFQVVFEAIRQLMTPPAQTRAGRIGFKIPPK